MRARCPLRARILKDNRDWEAMTDEQVIAAH
jgi:hypothetical protein